MAHKLVALPSRLLDHVLPIRPARRVYPHGARKQVPISIVAKVPSRAEFTAGRDRGQVIECRVKAILAR